VRSAAAIAPLALAAQAQTFIGPWPRRSAADAPCDLSGDVQPDDLEDGLLDVTGVVSSLASLVNPVGITGSVDADDGGIDQAGAPFGSLAPNGHGDGNVGGGAAEERSFGVVHAGGIGSSRSTSTRGGLAVGQLPCGTPGPWSQLGCAQAGSAGTPCPPRPGRGGRSSPAGQGAGAFNSSMQST